MPTRLKVPSNLSSLNVAGRMYEPDEDGYIETDNPDHVPTLKGFGCLEQTDFAIAQIRAGAPDLNTAPVEELTAWLRTNGVEVPDWRSVLVANVQHVLAVREAGLEVKRGQQLIDPTVDAGAAGNQIDLEEAIEAAGAAPASPPPPPSGVIDLRDPEISAAGAEQAVSGSEGAADPGNGPLAQNFDPLDRDHVNGPGGDLPDGYTWAVAQDGSPQFIVNSQGERVAATAADLRAYIDAIAAGAASVSPPPPPPVAPPVAAAAPPKPLKDMDWAELKTYLTTEKVAFAGNASRTKLLRLAEQHVAAKAG